MNKKFGIYAIIWAILLAAFNAVCFVTPNEVVISGVTFTKFTSSFWAAYVFVTIAFVGMLICGFFALKPENLTKLFYNLPLITISYSGLVSMVAVNSYVMSKISLPNWIAIGASILVLAFTTIAVINAKVAATVVAQIDENIQEKTLFIKTLTIDAESLIGRALTDESKKVCQKVYEAIRYADPMSSDALVTIEDQITSKFNEFSDAVNSGKDSMEIVANELIALINDRNRKCKLLK